MLYCMHDDLVGQFESYSNPKHVLNQLIIMFDHIQEKIIAYVCNAITVERKDPMVGIIRS